MAHTHSHRFFPCPGRYVEGDYQYTGAWDNDQPHGLGTCTFASGSSYEGMWREGKYEGTGTFTWRDGRHYKVWSNH